MPLTPLETDGMYVTSDDRNHNFEATAFLILHIRLWFRIAATHATIRTNAQDPTFKTGASDTSQCGTVGRSRNCSHGHIHEASDGRAILSSLKHTSLSSQLVARRRAALQPCPPEQLLTCSRQAESTFGQLQQTQATAPLFPTPQCSDTHALPQQYVVVKLHSAWQYYLYFYHICNQKTC